MDGETGEFLWSQHYAGPGDGNESAFSIACDDAGNAYVTGRARSGPQTDDIITMKLAADDGDVLWMKLTGGADAQDDRGWSIIVGPDGHPVCTGITTNTDGSADYVTFKRRSSDGSLIWIQSFPGAINNVDERAGWLAVCDNGDVIMANRTWNASTSYDVVLHRYAAADGDTLWTGTYGSAGSRPDNPRAVARDAAGNILVAGVRSGDYMVLKFSSDTGELLWPAHYNGAANGYDTANCVMEGPNGEVIASGFTSGVGTGWDATTVAFDPDDGTLLWQDSFDAGGGRTEEGSAIAVSNVNDLYVVGYGYGLQTDQDLLSLRYHSETTGVPGEPAPAGMILSAYPNPSGGSVRLSLDLQVGMTANLTIYDPAGCRRTTVSKGFLSAGRHRVLWNGRDDNGRPLPAGVYVAMLEGNRAPVRAKIVLTH